MSEYRISREAKSDLKRIYKRGILEFGEKQADRYYFALFNKIGLVAEKPLMFQSVDHIRKGYRRAVCGPDSIYYRLDQSGLVEIMRIIRYQNPESL